MRFSAGRTVLYRNFSGRWLSAVRPCRVIADDERGLLLWLARGTPVVGLRAADGRGVRDMPFGEWVRTSYVTAPGSWVGPGVLKFIPPEGNHSVWFFRDDDGRFACWYVNLEEHAVRWDDGMAAGVDVTDQDLDIVVQPDRSWEWKDEDEFAERLGFPADYWVGDPEAVRAEGRRVSKMAEAGEFPFDGTWTGFQPDPSWPIPAAVPDGWDRPFARL